MTVHDDFEAKADLLAAGGLDEAEAREVTEHANACPACGALLKDAQEFTKWATGTVAPDAPPGNLEDRIVARFRATAPPEKSASPALGQVAKALLTSIAAIVFFSVLGSIFTRTTDVVTVQDAAPIAMQTERTWALESPPPAFKDKDSSGEWAGYNGIPTVGGVHHAAGQNHVHYTLDHDSYQHWQNLGWYKGGKDIYSSGAVQGIKGEGALQPDASEPAPAVVEPPPPPDDDPLGPQVSTVAVAGDAGEEAMNNRPSLLLQDNLKIIRNATTRIRVESFDTAYAEINRILGEEKGFIAGAQTYRRKNGKISARITVRIPADQFNQALTKFRALGEVIDQSVTTEDVTKDYVDYTVRLSAKTALLERLKKVLAEAKGTVKELAEVEVQLGETLEEIEAIKGELRFMDNRIRLSTIMLEIEEKDFEQPFEYVETLRSTLALTVEDIRSAFAKAQTILTDAGGRVIDSKLTRQNDDSATASVKGRIAAENFPAVREELRKLGYATTDTVDQAKSARGGKEAAADSETPVRREEAAVNLTLQTPPIIFTRGASIRVEAASVETTYTEARRSVETAGGAVVGGGLTGGLESKSATVRAIVDADAFATLVESLKTSGTLKNADVTENVPPPTIGGRKPLVRERARIELTITSPPSLIAEDEGFGATLRDTFSGSVSGILWSLEKLVVGIALAGPWLLPLILAITLYRRWKKKRAGAEAKA